MLGLAEIWSAVGASATVAAALAALVTILYARSTVQETRQAREQSHRDHMEEIAAQAKILEASSAEHRDEMAQRHRVFEAETKLQRLAQIERIAEAVFDVIAAARQEHIEPSPKIAAPMPFRATLLPAVLARLRAVVAVLDTLGGPQMEAVSKLADMSFGFGTQPMELVSAGMDALTEIGWVVHKVSESDAP